MSIWKWFGKSPKKTARPAARLRTARPALEELENRDVPSSLACSFANGVWRWNEGTGWERLIPVPASIIATSSDGIVVCEFPNGVWRYSDLLGWQHLTPAAPSSLGVNAAGSVVAEFPGLGVWRYENVTGWQRLTPADAMVNPP
jgi:hypothetical protein